MAKIDHINLATGRVATQYRESANLINYIKALLIESNTLEDVFCDLIENRTLENAAGVNLDIIGAIVGQSRSFIDAEIFDYFGFDGHIQASSFGSLIDPSLGGRFRANDEAITGIRLLDDEEYRLFIRARIVKNSTSSTPEEIISQISFLFGSALIVISEGSNASYQISIGKNLSSNEKILIQNTTLIPKTAGVSVGYVSEFDSANFYGFQGVAGASGFGSINNSAIGGTFSNLI